MATTNIYVLKLAGGKYYVGKSENPQQRFQQHLAGSGSSWTRKYKPIAIEKVIPNCSPLDEDKYTKEYMMKHGMDNVRGGTYVEIKLDDFQQEALSREFWSARDACMRCGRPGHFVKDCKAYHDIRGNKLFEEVWCCEKCDKEFDDEKECEKHERYCKKEEDTILSYMKTGISLLSTLHKALSDEKPTTRVVCYRCKRTGHYANECYASTNVYGKRLY